MFTGAEGERSSRSDYSGDLPFIGYLIYIYFGYDSELVRGRGGGGAAGALARGHVCGGVCD